MHAGSQPAQEIVADVMQEYHDDFHTVMCNNPALIARKLFSEKFIERSTLRNVRTIELPDDAKADDLLMACMTFITTHESPLEMLQKFLLILEECDSAGPNVAEAVRKVSINATIILSC